VLAARGGHLVRAKAHDPLGREIDAEFALLDDGRTALVETAVASGLQLLAPSERDPWVATSHGTGELIGAALDTGAETVLVAAGGSATVDGGAGALDVLARRGGRLGGARIVVLCDVRTPWEQCARIYGPQKGAPPQLVPRLAARLDAYARGLPRDPRGVTATGAAGGISGALWAAFGATLEPGAGWVLDAVGFDERLGRAAVVIGGEGRLDMESQEGKVISEIARRARRRAVPLHVIVGQCAVDDGARRDLHIASIIEARTLAEIAAEAELLATRLRANVVPSSA
jgi:glycerate kinase